MAHWDGSFAYSYTLRLTVDFGEGNPETRKTPYSWALDVLGSGTSWQNALVSTVSVTVGVGIYSATVGFDWRSGSSRRIASGSGEITHNADGTVGTEQNQWRLPIAASFNTAAHNLGTASISTTTTVPTLTLVPNAPTGVTGTRVSDSQINVNWSQSSPSNGQPATNSIQRRVDGGSPQDVVTIAATSGVSVDAAANQKIEYRVRGSNSAGDSDWSAWSAPVFTTPAAPTGVVAAKDENLDIVVTFTPQVGYSEHVHPVEHGTVTGGVTTWDDVPLASVAAGTVSFKHVDPDPAQVHVYRVSAKNTDTDARQSAKVVSNQVQLLVAPGKPTTPGFPAFADKGKDFPFAWTHNAIDTTAQTAYEVEYSTNAGSSWTSTGKVTSTTPVRTFDADTYSADQALMVRVRTWGQATSGGSDGTGASPWSDPQTVTFKTRPVVVIASPIDESTWTQAELAVELGFSQAESASFVQATITLSDGDGEIETVVSTTLASTALESRVEDGESYTVTVTVLDSNGIVSDPVTAEFDVAYTLPVAAVANIVYLPNSGIAQINLTFPSPSDDEVAAVAVTITREINGTRETIVAAYPISGPNLTILDTTPTIAGLNTYRITTISDDGATARVIQPLSPNEPAWAFLSAGPGFSRIVSFRDNLTIGSTPGRDRALVHTAGRARPIALFGENTTLEVSGSATLFAGVGSTPEEIEAFLLEAERVCYRDPSGRRMFGTVMGALSDRGPWVTGFAFTVTEAT